MAKQKVNNKANLRDLIAATGLIILLKMDSNRWFFSPYELEIWWMTSKNNRAPFLYYIKLCASFQCHRWIQSRVTVRKCSILSKLVIFVPCQLKIWWMTLENNRAPLLYYTKLCASFQSHVWIENGVTVRKRPIWAKLVIFLVPCDLEIWQMALEKKRAPLLCYFKLCASFCSHW